MVLLWLNEKKTVEITSLLSGQVFSTRRQCCLDNGYKPLFNRLCGHTVVVLFLFVLHVDCRDFCSKLASAWLISISATCKLRVDKATIAAHKHL